MMKISPELNAAVWAVIEAALAVDPDQLPWALAAALERFECQFELDGHLNNELSMYGDE